MNILTIDTGTTNTRTSLWCQGQVIGRGAAAVGARDTAITGSSSALHQAVRASIDAALTEAHVTADEIDLVIGSGMITSSLGLHELPHIVAPVGIDDLAQSIACLSFPDVFDQPIYLVPGVRNAATTTSLGDAEAMDMMRGEEVEVMGLIARLQLRGPALLVLPGSHSKFIAIDASNRITGCVTTIAGEMLSAITQQTILSAALDSGFATEIDPEMLLAGAATARRVGLARACFNVRILNQFQICERNARANFLLGAILALDLLALRNTRALDIACDTPIIIAGQAILREAMRLLFGADSHFTGPVTVISDSQQADLAGCGAIEIAAARKLAHSSCSTIGEK
jgi:2-dehydro-3-deoxygalactonokinase